MSCEAPHAFREMHFEFEKLEIAFAMLMVRIQESSEVIGI